MIFTRDSKTLHFIAIPKTGTTTIVRALEESGWLLGEEYSSNRVSNHEPSYVWRKTLAGRDFDYSFSIVRDPVERFTSKISSTLSREAGVPYEEIKLGNWMTRSAYAALSEMLPMHGKDFYDYHYVPQHCFPVRDTEIFKFENFNQIVDTLKSRGILDKNCSIGHKNKTDESVRSLKIDFNYKNLKDFFLGWYGKDFEIFDYDMKL